MKLVGSNKNNQKKTPKQVGNKQKQITQKSGGLRKDEQQKMRIPWLRGYCNWHTIVALSNGVRYSIGARTRKALEGHLHINNRIELKRQVRLKLPDITSEEVELFDDLRITNDPAVVTVFRKGKEKEPPKFFIRKVNKQKASS